MLPFNEWSVFEEVRQNICAGRSYVIHGSYQSGKSSFLMALQEELQKQPEEAVVTLFNISYMKIPNDAAQDEDKILGVFSRFFSARLFHEKLSWEDLTIKLEGLPPSPRHYVLVDEFQSIFNDPVLLRVAKNFFRNLSNRAVSYVCVGTFRLTELILDDGKMDSPFNKAVFARMPPFDVKEMVYSLTCTWSAVTQMVSLGGFRTGS